MGILRTHCIGAAILLCAAGCASVGTRIDAAIGTSIDTAPGNSIGRITPAPRDHYDPAYLNEAAVAAWSKGERGTALILLERAAVIAPQDRRILDNLETLRNAGSRAVLMRYGPLPEGKVAPSSKQASAVEKATAPPAPQSSTPAGPAPEIGLWPLK